MMTFDQLAKLATAATSIVQHGVELVDAVSSHVKASKAALSTTELETLTQMLDASHKRSVAAAAALDAKLAKIANG